MCNLWMHQTRLRRQLFAGPAGTPPRSEATLRPEQVVSVQITYHPGWRALANGESCRVFADGLGQIVAEPHCGGACKLELIYDGGLEMRAATIVSGVSWLGCVGWILFYKRKR